MFNSASAFNFNFEILAPECTAKVSYAEKACAPACTPCLVDPYCVWDTPLCCGCERASLPIPFLACVLFFAVFHGSTDSNSYRLHRHCDVSGCHRVAVHPIGREKGPVVLPGHRLGNRSSVRSLAHTHLHTRSDVHRATRNYVEVALASFCRCHSALVPLLTFFPAWIVSLLAAS